MGDRWEQPAYGPPPGDDHWGPPGDPAPAGSFPAYGGFDPGGVPRVGDTAGPWSSAGAEAGDGQMIGRPPFVWLVGGLVLGLVAAGLAWQFGAYLWVAVAAWVLAGPVAIGLLAVFVRQDVQQRARPLYDAPSWIRVLYCSTIAAVALGIGVGAWNIALWAGRL